MADRFTYVPQIGVLIAVVWWIHDLLPGWRRRDIVLGFLGITACLSMAAFTTRQLGTMKDNESLYRQMLSVNPNDQATRFSLGILVLGSGRVAEGTALLRGVEYRLDPVQLKGVLIKVAVRHYLDGALDKALEYFTKVLRVSPGNEVALRATRRLTMMGARLPPGAKSTYTVKELIDEQEAKHWLLEGNALVSCGDYASALDRYQKSLELRPISAEAWNNLGSSYGKLNRVREAAAAFEKALIADPGYQQARSNLERAQRLLSQ